MSTCFSDSPPSLQFYMLSHSTYCLLIEMEIKYDDDAVSLGLIYQQ